MFSVFYVACFLRITNKLHPTVSTYTMETNIIKQATSVKYLGITINEKLQWSEHISKITNKANGTLSFLRRNLKNCPSHIKSSCYKSLVVPILEYGCTVWDPHLQEKFKDVQPDLSKMIILGTQVLLVL